LVAQGAGAVVAEAANRAIALQDEQMVVAGFDLDGIADAEIGAGVVTRSEEPLLPSSPDCWKPQVHTLPSARIPATAVRQPSTSTMSEIEEIACGRICVSV